MTRICIAVPTFRRPSYLPDLLAAISKLAVPADCSINVLVADNDSERSARALITDAQAAFPFPLRYEAVAQAGLSNVRNAVLSIARAHADALAMLDDDELPEPHWLTELTRIAQITGADAVVGPVAALLPDDAPQFVHDFRAREYPPFKDGQRVTDGWSSNCLLNLTTNAARGLSFDLALNFIGGEDQLFFRQLLANGGTIAYAASALAWERLPAERRSYGFILKRSFRRGSSLAMCDRVLHGTLRGLGLRAAKGLVTIGKGAVKLDSSEIARGAGMLAGLAGVSYYAYRRGA